MIDTRPGKKSGAGEFRGVKCEVADAPGRAAPCGSTLLACLFVTLQPDEALAEWRAWGQLLGMPLLLAEQNKVSQAANAQLGELHIERPRPRRRRRSALKLRRPSILLRRGYGKISETTRIHRGEREIIARN
jgi:hypothetical protein